MCTIKNHKAKMQLLSSGLEHGIGYNGEFSCSDCGEVILIVRHGIRFVPVLFINDNNSLNSDLIQATPDQAG